MSEKARGQGGGVAGEQVTAERDEDDEISLRPHFETVWRHRRVLKWASTAVLLAFTVGLLLSLLVFPPQRIASVQFRLLFDGAAQSRYPNGQPFSPAEIVGAPVVIEVYAKNDLQRFGKYEAFKESLFIQQSNPALDLLALEYQSKLSDTKLTPVDRARIEDEFKKKREALLDPVFSLTLRRSERLTALPRDLVQKVLTDTLDTWAQQADQRKGALRYQVPVFSSNVLSRQSLESEDYFVAADLLRSKSLRIIETIAELEEVPGALTIRTAKDNISLPEIRASIEDAVRFDLEPLLGIIRSEGITRNARLLSLYASNQLFQLRLDRQAAQGRAQVLQDSLRDYMSQRVSRSGSGAAPGTSGAPARQGGSFETPALIPQFGESFLDRLVEMSTQTQTSDVLYRQKLTDQIIAEGTHIAQIDKELAYYEDLVQTVRGITGRSGTPELVAFIKKRSQTAFDSISKATDQMRDLYKELSEQNLMPEARLYAITGPFAMHTTSALAFRSVALAFVLVMMLTLIVVPVGILVYDATRKRRV